MSQSSKEFEEIALLKTSGITRKRISVFAAVLLGFGLIITGFLFFPPTYVHQSNSVPEGCISSDQAYRTAIPHIREYAQENGRLILRIDITFWNSSRDMEGQRGNDSSRYPLWVVSAGFLNNPFDEWPIFGYTVLIWADTGEIRHEGAEGVM